MKLFLAAALFALSCATAHADWWKPTTAGEWQWMIDHALRLNNTTDMGTGITAFTGAKPPATEPVVYDIDGFNNPVATVTALHATSKKTICYIEVGAAENYRSDYAQFEAIPKALGNSEPSYPDEKYIDIRLPAVVAIIEARIKMCATKGFDAIEPDIDDTYGNDTGFPLTQANWVVYMTTLSTYAHSLNVAFFSKNCTENDDDYCVKLAPITDGAIIEQCNQYSECGPAITAYAGKAVFNAEYKKGSLPKFCPKDNARPGWNGTLFPPKLNGGRAPCK